MLPVTVSNRRTLLTPGPPTHFSTRAQLEEEKLTSTTYQELASLCWSTTRSACANSGVAHSARAATAPVADHRSSVLDGRRSNTITIDRITAPSRFRHGSE